MKFNKYMASQECAQSFLHFVRIKNSCHNAQWISKAVQPHIQKLQGKSTSKICIYFFNVDSLLTIKTLGSLEVKMHDFQSKGHSLSAIFF